MTLFATLQPNGSLTDELELDLHKLPSKDPLAFGYGISTGLKLRGEKYPDFKRVHGGGKWSELAQEYLRGFLLGYKSILVPEGTKIKKGEETCYALLHLNTLKKE